RPPFIYSAADIEALIAGVPRLIPTPLRAATFQTMIGLLAATGMFSRGHPLWRKPVLRVCAAQRLME
ncbi:MAG: hypothetical protein ACLP7J_18330, partial [Streptosporangiaceae bacterium]